MRNQHHQDRDHCDPGFAGRIPGRDRASRHRHSEHHHDRHHEAGWHPLAGHGPRRGFLGADTFESGHDHRSELVGLIHSVRATIHADESTRHRIDSVLAQARRSIFAILAEEPAPNPNEQRDATDEAGTSE